MPKFKKEIYKFTEVGAMLYDMFPGHYLNLKSAIATVNTNARALGIKDINGKKKHRHMTAKEAERVLTACEYCLRQNTATPIEKAVKDAEKTKTETVADNMTTEEIVNKPEITSEDLKAYIDAMAAFYDVTHATPEERAAITAAAPALSPKTATEKKAEADAFEVLRKKFYTDVNYFIKYAQTPQERLAIWDTIGKLYGLTRLGG